MKREWTKIEFLRERPFGKRMGAPFSFIAENAGILLRLSVGFLLPTLLLASGFISWGIAHLLKFSTIGYITPSALIAFALALASILLLTLLVPSFSYTLLKLYNQRDTRLKGVNFGDVMQAMKPVFIKMSYLLFFFLLIGFLSFLFQIKVAAWVSTIVFIMIFLGIGVPLFLLTPAYLLDEEPLWKSLTRSFRQGYPHWLSTLSFWFVLKLISGCFTLLIGLPWIVTTYIEQTFFASSANFDIPFLYQSIIFLFTLLMLAGTVISSLFVQIGMAYQYAHTSMNRPQLIVVDDINSIE
jgi:hypothetical protein